MGKIFEFEHIRLFLHVDSSVNVIQTANDKDDDTIENSVSTKIGRKVVQNSYVFRPKHLDAEKIPYIQPTQ